MKSPVQKSVKLLSVLLAGLMLGGTLTAFAYTAPPAKEESVPNASSTAVAAQSEPMQENAFKDETVYVLAGADGSVQKVIVSDWLKNTLGAETLSDYTELSDPANVKGDEGYTMNPNNMRVWDASGKDLYYQGEIEKSLPVDISIRYRLDGKSISAEDLAGKSGRVTMRFDYTNHQKQTVQIDGKEETVYVPFVMLTGMLLDNNTFSNVSVTNGKVLNDGDRSAVIGFALPGMQESLGLSKEKLELPDYVEISADVKEFSLTTTMTVATNELFSELDLDRAGDINALTSSLDELNDACAKLVDGSSDLYSGLSTLLQKSDTLIQGIDDLTAGAEALSNGADSLKEGASTLSAGVSDLSDGLKTLSGNSQALKNGSKQVFESLLSMADTQLAAAGLSVPKLTIDNYSSVLANVLASLDQDAVYKLAYNTALSEVTAAVEAQESTIRAQVEAAVKAKVLEGVLAASGNPMTAEEYEKAVAAGLIPQDVAAQVSAALAAQMQSDGIKAQISSSTKAQMESIIAQKMQDSEVTSQIEAAVEKAEAGTNSIAALKTQLDSYREFYLGLGAYTDGVDKAYTGSTQLKSGASALSGGAADLSAGAKELLAGLGTLKSGSSALIDGVSQLTEGSMQLSDGMKAFQEEGIKKLVDAFEGDLGGLVARLRAVSDAAKGYQSFAGISDEMNGSVRFVYRTDSIG